MQIDDIPNGVEWKDQPAEWWMEHGATVATRFLIPPNCIVTV